MTRTAITGDALLKYTNYDFIEKAIYVNNVVLITTIDASSTFTVSNNIYSTSTLQTGDLTFAAAQISGPITFMDNLLVIFNTKLT